MIRITCPACLAEYDLSVQSVGPAGRKVRCSSCHTQWLVEPPATGLEETRTEPEVTSTPAEIAEPPTARSPRRRPWHDRIAMPDGPARARWPAAAAIALLALGTGLVAFRKPIVARAPETGRVYAALGLPVNLTGLALQDVKSGIFSEGGTELLVVQGIIANVTGDTRSVPRLKFTIRDGKGVDIYSWTAQADAKDLKPGETQTFRRRLASPPAEGAEVLVRFASKADLIALAK